jgi:hypothetical protein
MEEICTFPWATWGLEGLEKIEKERPREKSIKIFFIRNSKKFFSDYQKFFFTPRKRDCQQQLLLKMEGEKNIRPLKE